ncbi:hypothetical protein ACH5RR_037801 [Cinchona calisaya]|uniref:Uncharacterized protein n=1 Tax=Cinchona calisaya TaxID=153742 RepID=A0ABD2Y794_9GENT
MCRIMAPRKDKSKKVLVSHEETHNEQELERNQEKVEEPYEMNDEDEKDVEMNIPIGGILRYAKRAAWRQHKREARKANPQQAEVTSMASTMAQAFNTFMQQIATNLPRPS